MSATLTRTHRPLPVLVASLAASAELVGDKLPAARSRLDQPGPPIRAASGAFGAVLLARREGRGLLLPALAGAAGGLAGTYGGAAWRRWAADRVPDWQAALAEDVVALTAVFLATRSPRVVVR